MKIPKQATNIDHMGYYWDFLNSLIWIDGEWRKDISGLTRIWYPLNHS